MRRPTPRVAAASAAADRLGVNRVDVRDDEKPVHGGQDALGDAHHPFTQRGQNAGQRIGRCGVVMDVLLGPGVCGGVCDPSGRGWRESPVRRPRVRRMASACRAHGGPRSWATRAPGRRRGRCRASQVLCGTFTVPPQSERCRSESGRVRSPRRTRRSISMEGASTSRSSADSMDRGGRGRAGVVRRSSPAFAGTLAAPYGYRRRSRSATGLGRDGRVRQRCRTERKVAGWPSCHRLGGRRWCRGRGDGSGGRCGSRPWGRALRAVGSRLCDVLGCWWGLGGWDRLVAACCSRARTLVARAGVLLRMPGLCGSVVVGAHRPSLLLLSDVLRGGAATGSALGQRTGSRMPVRGWAPVQRWSRRPAAPGRGAGPAVGCGRGLPPDEPERLHADQVQHHRVQPAPQREGDVAGVRRPLTLFRMSRWRRGQRPRSGSPAGPMWAGRGRVRPAGPHRRPSSAMRRVVSSVNCRDSTPGRARSVGSRSVSSQLPGRAQRHGEGRVEHGGRADDFEFGGADQLVGHQVFTEPIRVALARRTRRATPRRRSGPRSSSAEVAVGAPGVSIAPTRPSAGESRHRGCRRRVPCR